MNAERILADLNSLTLAELVQVDEAVHELIDRIREWQQPEWDARRKQTGPAGSKTYQQEYVKCGKAGCHCENDEGHGPYWYAYWSENGKTRKKYVGKQLREV